MKLVKSVLSASILAAAAQTAVAVEITPYASIRANLVGDAGNEDWSDAYSRAGITASEEFDSIKLTYNFEAKYDPFGDAHNTLEDGRIRQNNIKVSGDFGSLTIGKTWTPFYNVVMYDVGFDRFKSARAGWGDNTVDGYFRIDETLFYSSPDMNGLQIQASVSSSNNNNNRQLAGTYKLNENITLGAGVTTGDSASDKDRGFGIRYNKDEWTLTANYMETDANSDAEFINLYAGYAIDEKNSVSADFTDKTVDNVSSNPYTLAYHHTYNEALNVFVEYYNDDTNNNAYPAIGFNYSF